MTTLAEELAETAKNLVWLLEVELCRRVDARSWTANGSPNGDVYWMDHSATGAPSRVREAVRATGAEAELDEVASIAAAQAAAGSWYYDPATSRLHVHATAGGSPGGGTYYVASHAWLRFCGSLRPAPQEVVFNGHPYRARLSVEDIARIVQRVSSAREGGYEESFGSLRILNGDGLYDPLLDPLEFFWVMSRFILRGGAAGAAYSDFEAVYEGRFSAVTSWTRDAFELAVADQAEAEE